jgi:hypothetical protein
MGPTALSGPPIFMIPFLAVVVFLLSFAIVHLILKIPILRESV